jgi:hypothetical protein
MAKDIKLVKLGWGTTVVCEIEYDKENKKFTFWRPIELIPLPTQPPTTIMQAFMIGAEPEDITVDEGWVVCITEPKDELVKQYRERFGSGVVVPPKKKLVL